jgi:hypothetical protein
MLLARVQSTRNEYNAINKPLQVLCWSARWFQLLQCQTVYLDGTALERPRRHKRLVGKRITFAPVRSS